MSNNYKGPEVADLVNEFADELRKAIDCVSLGTLCAMPFEGVVKIIEDAIKAGMRIERDKQACYYARISGIAMEGFYQHRGDD